MPNGVCIIGAGCLKRILKVINRLSHLALKVIIIVVVGLLVVVALAAVGSDCDMLGSPFWPPLVSLGTPL
jgi:hypothetical protein